MFWRAALWRPWLGLGTPADTGRTNGGCSISPPPPPSQDAAAPPPLPPSSMLPSRISSPGCPALHQRRPSGFSRPGPQSHEGLIQRGCRRLTSMITAETLGKATSSGSEGRRLLQSASWQERWRPYGCRGLRMHTSTLHFNCQYSAVGVGSLMVAKNHCCHERDGRPFVEKKMNCGAD